MKKRDYIIYPVIAVAVGALAGLLTRQSVKEVFPLLEKPPLTPPALLFPIVWTALYILMGVGMAEVRSRGGAGRRRAERRWCFSSRGSTLRRWSCSWCSSCSS